MKKSFTITGVFVLVAALYAWGSRPTDQTKSAPRWEFKQITRTTMVIDMTRLPQDDPPDEAGLKGALNSLNDQVKKAKKDFETSLSAAGAQGWELVAVTSEPQSIVGSGLGANTLTAFLKRLAK